MREGREGLSSEALLHVTRHQGIRSPASPLDPPPSHFCHLEEGVGHLDAEECQDVLHQVLCRQRDSQRDDAEGRCDALEVDGRNAIQEAHGALLHKGGGGGGVRGDVTGCCQIGSDQGVILLTNLHS